MRESNLVLIDVGLLLDVRFPGALQVFEVEFSVPPQSSSFFLLLDDVRLLLEQIADHSGEVGFVGLRHARIIRPGGGKPPNARPLPNRPRPDFNTDTEGPWPHEPATRRRKIATSSTKPMTKTASPP